MTEREKLYRNIYVCIGETLVDESKYNITSEQACEKIRNYLRDLRYGLDVITDLEEHSSPTLKESEFYTKKEDDEPTFKDRVIDLLNQEQSNALSYEKIETVSHLLYEIKNMYE